MYHCLQGTDQLCWDIWGIYKHFEVCRSVNWFASSYLRWFKNIWKLWRTLCPRLLQSTALWYSEEEKIRHTLHALNKRKGTFLKLIYVMLYDCAKFECGKWWATITATTDAEAIAGTWKCPGSQLYENGDYGITGPPLQGPVNEGLPPLAVSFFKVVNVGPCFF